MACDRPTPLALAFPVVAAAALLPDAAAADSYAGLTAGPCFDPGDAEPGPGGDVGGAYDYCAGVQALDDLTPLQPAKIPVDGALVLQAAYRGAWDPGIVDRAAVTISGADGEVPGRLDLTLTPGILVWNPDAAWIPATYTFSAAITNPTSPGGCAEDSAAEAEFTVTAEASDALLAPDLSGEEELIVTPIVGLDTLACCPGFAPTLYTPQCGGAASIQFDAEQCTPLFTDGTLVVEATASAAAAAPTSSQVYYELTVDGTAYAYSVTREFLVTLQKPFCATVTAHHYTTGASKTGPMTCFGAAHADKLGTVDVVPPDAFTCSLRQCEVQDNTWDLAACTPLDPDHPNEPAADDSDKGGCGCTTDASDSAAGLALVGLAGLALRRRRR